MREPRRAEGRRCMDGAVMEARRVTSPAAIFTCSSYTTILITQHNLCLNALYNPPTLPIEQRGKFEFMSFGSMIGEARAIGLRSGSQRVPGTASVINRKCNRCKCRESFSGRAGPMFIFTPRSVTAVAETISGQIHMIFDRRACSRGWCQFYARSKRAQISRYAEFRPVLI